MFILKDYLSRTKLLLSLFVFSSLIAFGVFFYFNGSSKQARIIEEKPLVKEIKNKYSLDISDKAFSSQKSFSLDEFFPDFSNKIKLIMEEIRPDSVEKEKNLEMILLSDNISKMISSGDKIYLAYDNGYKISESPTNLWLLISQMAPNSSKVTLGTKYLDQNSISCEKEKSFDLATAEREINEAALRDDQAYLSLKSAIFLGPDLSLDFKDKDKEKAQLNRLIFSSNESCFIKNGDFLVFKEGKWQIAQDDTKEFSLAKVSMLNPNSLDIDYWKKGERGRARIKLNKPSPGSGLHVNDDFISELNVRTKKQVSCKIQGQRIVLTEKDLLYKKEGIWKKGILSDFENRNDVSDFFLFEKLEVSPGSKTFVGYLFNPDRTQMAKVEKKIVKKISEPQTDKVSKIRQVKKRR